MIDFDVLDWLFTDLIASSDWIALIGLTVSICFGWHEFADLIDLTGWLDFVDFFFLLIWID